jgi:Icc-related predicted phosphoesterase
MKILLVSDLHYALKQYDWTLAVAPNFDLVVIAGDHLDVSGHVEGSVQIVVILKYLQRLKACAPLIVSSGNHDLDMRNAAGEKIALWMNRARALGIPTDGDTVRFGDALVTICPWWDGPDTMAMVQAQIERDAAEPKKSWIWVYHAPPEGSPTSWTGRRFYGDAPLLGWIERHKPDLVFAGHIHEAPFQDGGSWADRIGPTWIFNCGRQLGPTPTHVMIDTEAQEARWVSLDSAQLLRLDRPLQRPFEPITVSPDALLPISPDLGPSRA